MPHERICAAAGVSAKLSGDFAQHFLFYNLFITILPIMVAKAKYNIFIFFSKK